MSVNAIKKEPLRSCVLILAPAAMLMFGSVNCAAAQSVRAETRRADTVEELQKLVPSNVKVTSAVQGLTSELVAYTRVDGVITVDNPGPSQIHFMAALPKTFNGRYFMMSQGGTGGQVPDPDPALLREGYVVASNDRGTKPAFNIDSSVWSDPVQGVNLAHRGVHAAAVATQQLTRAYYGVSSFHRYMAGCSGGGVAGWNNMRSHGADDFDGIVIGDSAPVGPTNTVQWARILQYLLNHPDGWISPALLAAAQKAIIQKYDGVDGAIDGIIQDERLIHFDEDVLRTIGFSEAQMKMFRFARADWTYRLTTPTLTMRGLPLTRLTDWTTWYFGTQPPPWTDLTPPGAPLSYLSTKAVFDALPSKPDLRKVNLDDPKVQALYARPDGSTTAPFDFRKFRDGGGKVLLYFGNDDPIGAFLPYAVPAIEGSRALEANPQDLDTWLRGFSVPGMLHCRGGVGPDDVPQQAFKAIVDWVEKGTAPQSMTAHRRDGRSFLLCPEPSRAVFSGGTKNPKSLDVNDSSNWSCKSL